MNFSRPAAGSQPAATRTVETETLNVIIDPVRREELPRHVSYREPQRERPVMAAAGCAGPAPRVTSLTEREIVSTRAYSALIVLHK